MKQISFSRKEESLSAKAAWFQKKSIGDRLVAALEWLDFVRAIAPQEDITHEDAHKTFRSVRVLKPRRH